MVDFVVGFVILAIVGGAVAYIVKEKKKGVKCIGCPDSAVCSGQCSGCNGGCNYNPSEQENTDTKE